MEQYNLGFESLIPSQAIFNRLILLEQEGR